MKPQIPYQKSTQNSLAGLMAMYKDNDLTPRQLIDVLVEKHSLKLSSAKVIACKIKANNAALSQALHRIKNLGHEIPGKVLAKLAVRNPKKRPIFNFERELNCILLAQKMHDRWWSSKECKHRTWFTPEDYQKKYPKDGDLSTIKKAFRILQRYW